MHEGSRIRNTETFGQESSNNAFMYVFKRARRNIHQHFTPPIYFVKFFRRNCSVEPCARISFLDMRPVTEDVATVTHDLA